MLSDEPDDMDPRMALYFQQVHDVMRRIRQLAAKEGMPHTISVTAHFERYTLTNDVRVFGGDDDRE